MVHKVADVLSWLRSDGWFQIWMRGSHRHFAHPQKSGIVTVAGRKSQDLLPKTYASILRQAGLK